MMRKMMMMSESLHIPVTGLVRGHAEPISMSHQSVSRFRSCKACHAQQ